jgi:hypothetical protein
VKSATGVERIAAERARQNEGWSAAHDDEHDTGALAMAACCYAAPQRLYVRCDYAAGVTFNDPWPWDQRDDHRPYDGNVLIDPTDEQAIRLLEKAGALIAAEIDRLLRAQARKKKL